MRSCRGGWNERLGLSPMRLAVLGLCGGMHFAGEAQAQASTEPSSAEARDVQSLDLVTVTAQRRREPAREVPLTADVLKGETLARGGYQSLRDVAALLPGLNFSQSTAATGQSQITMRGVTTGSQVGATVGIYVDDVPFGSSSAYAGGGAGALDLGLFDLSNVEVLRGPQGTLYGASAMGGLIKYVSAEPEKAYFGGQATAELSSVKGGRVGHVLRGLINVPMMQDTAALRVTVYQRREGGFTRDLDHDGRIVDGARTDGGRVALFLQPSKDVSVRVTAMTQRQDRDGSAQEEADVATGQPVDRRYTKRLFVSEPVTVRNDLVTAVVKADLHWATLESITGWQRSTNEGRADPSAFYRPYLSQLGIVNPGYALDYSFDNRKLSQEFRLTSARSRQLEWLVGAFYADERGEKSQHLMPLDAQLNPAQPLLADARFPSSYREIAAFGTATYYLTTRTDLTLGVRQSRNSQHLDQTFSGLFAPPPQPAASSTENVTTWLATARWRPADDQALYVRAASGYRPGGPLPVIKDPVTGQPLNKSFFKSDSLWSYEVGWKGTLIPSRLSSELALYQIDWNDIQVFTASAGFSGIGNAKRARSRGLEWSLRAMPAQGLRVSTALSLIDAKLLEDSPDLGGVAGERMPDTARTSAALQVDRDFEWLGRPAHLGFSWRHVGKRANAFKASPGNPLYRLPAYSALDLSGGIAFGRVNLDFYIRNLTNQHAQTGADTSLSLAGGPARVSVMAPRTVGLQLSAEF
ncbi:TonB-dependent receptor [Mitsuaria sp. GD03876]|uniref:TonB-dependent receptor n=1 Tax=Mitsuaria sp. GD03876 TaxID=2975399 RepID=UPI00244B61CA|nr:TonB-dependent receptor [Mitsuaria sp. GD03876]MDH0864718.1 TonB-dependent receptor [Mitsuaria sp. GD03876]